MSESASEKKPVAENKGGGVKYVYRGEGSHWWQPGMWNTGRFLSRVISLVLFRLRVMGTQDIPREGPVLMVTNHQSFLDPWLIGIGPRRQIHYMARDSLFKGGFLSWLMECLNSYPVKRGKADLQAIRMTTDLLERGYVVNIFPEGTRSVDGKVGVVAPGVSLIVSRCKRKVPIVPVVIDGAFEAWPRNRKIPRPGKIRILYGKPIEPETYAGMKPDQLAALIRGELVRLQREMGSVHAEAAV